MAAVTDRQKKFAEAFAACSNAAQAAREAGYSTRTARAQGARLLTNVDVADYIRQLKDEAAAGRIATMTQVRAFWSDVLSNPEEKTADRLKASELLARASGLFLHVRPGQDDENYRVAVGEVDGSDVVIYMPEITRAEDCEVEEDE